MLKSHNAGLATRDSGLIDVLFHPTSHAAFGDCPLDPPSEAALDGAGISLALVSQCKKWSCGRQWMCVDTRLEDVLRYTQSSPRLIGLAGYNPFDIAESLREIELAVSAHGFRGVYMHLASFNLALTDPRMYPLFAKAAELGVPAMLQLPPSAALAELDRLAADFPELSLVLAQARPELAELAALCARCENVFFALDPGALIHLGDAWSALTLERDQPASDLFSEILEQRCMWGSNGQDWRQAVRAADPLPLLPEARARFLHRNAELVFALDRPPASRAPRSALAELLCAER